MLPHAQVVRHRVQPRPVRRRRLGPLGECRLRLRPAVGAHQRERPILGPDQPWRRRQVRCLPGLWPPLRRARAGQARHAFPTMRREQLLNPVRDCHRRQTGARRPLLLPRPPALLLPALALRGGGPWLSPQAVARWRLGRVRRVQASLPSQLLDLALKLLDPARHAGLLLQQPVSLRLQLLDPPIAGQQPREQLRLMLGDDDRGGDGKIGEHRARHHKPPAPPRRRPCSPGPGSGPLSRLRGHLNSYLR